MDINDLKLSIYESAHNGLISTDSAYQMVDIIQEGVFSKSPLKDKLNVLKEIKNAKPKEYDGPEEAKKFVDKYYNDIIKCAELAEKEPSELRSNQVKALTGTMVTIIGGYATAMGGAASGILALSAGGFIAIMLGAIVSIVHSIITIMRASDDEKAADELAKIRTALKKIDTSKLPKDYKNKISDLIESIDDVETEISSRMKVAEESTDLKLKIYESCMNGGITKAQRDQLLDALNKK